MTVSQTQRYGDHQQAFIEGFEGKQASIMTSMPGIIQSAIAADGTCSVLPAIQAKVYAPDGVTANMANMPTLIHCPVQFPSGGGLYMTHPIAVGDECLIIFAQRCIDSWWQKGGVQPPLEFRMHDISDGFCIPGVSSEPNALANVSEISIQLRTKTAVIVDVAPMEVTIYGDLTVNGNITATENVNADLAATGSFTASSGQVVTVRNGVIVSIS
jgi:hypothetical protein